jgi:hypothetical protein
VFGLALRAWSLARVQFAIIKTIEDEDTRRGDGTSLGPTLVRSS